MKYRSRFVVAGSTEFPIDMLRYDCAWPVTSIDSLSIRESFSPASIGMRRIALFTQHRDRDCPITGEGWRLYGWTVIEVGPTTRLPP